MPGFTVLNNFARVQEPDGARLIHNEFTTEHYTDFLREIGAGIADGRIRYREDIVDGLERAPGAFIGMREGHNFGKLIVRGGRLAPRDIPGSSTSTLG